MWKRFIKFFKGTEAEPDSFDGGYFDHLLSRVEPRIIERLEHCPEHDPILLVVAEILLEAVPNLWNPDYKAPLLDELSPGYVPPVSLALDTTMEAEFGAADEADESLDDDSEVHLVELDLEELSEASEFSGRDSKDLEGFVHPLDETAEFVTSAVPSGAGRAASAGLRPLDTQEVLRAGRVLLNMLINNDRLPINQQLSVVETLLACDLWVGYMISADGLEAKGQKVLRLVEEKFSEGSFGQARLLLQLFQTDRATRLNNDRNLFYEDMILRLGIRRKFELGRDANKVIREAWTQARHDDDSSIRQGLTLMARHGFIQGHLYTREPEEANHWRQIVEGCTRPSAVPYFLSLIPPRRWREHGVQPDRPIKDMIREHVARPMIREYVIGQLKACYFILRAVGDTGLEAYLDGYFDWAQKHFNLDVTRIMPEIYQRTMLGYESTPLIFQDLFDKYFKEGVERIFAEVDDAALERALAQTLVVLARCDFNEVAPGNYDFGGLIIDQIVGRTYPRPEFAFKLHRLT
jgi:hypothetical protein